MDTQKIKTDIAKTLESKTLQKVFYTFGIIVLIGIIFQAGVVVGFHKAAFGRAWGENYEHNFGMMHRGPLGVPEHFPNAHGAAGKIIKIELPTLIVEDRDATEKVILLTDSTEIRNKDGKITAADLKIDDMTVIVGSPNENGQIEAKFIRVLPAMADMNNAIR